MELFNQKKLSDMGVILESYLKTFKSNYPDSTKDSAFDSVGNHKVLNLDFVVEDLSRQSLDSTLKLELLTDLLYAGEMIFKGIKNEIITTFFAGYELSSDQLGSLFTSYDFLTSEEKEVVQRWINTDYRMDISEMKTQYHFDEHSDCFIHESENDVWFYSSFL